MLQRSKRLHAIARYQLLERLILVMGPFTKGKNAVEAKISDKLNAQEFFNLIKQSCNANGCHLANIGT